MRDAQLRNVAQQGAGRRIQELEAQIAQLEQTRIAVDAGLQTVSLTIQRERERRIQLQNVESELTAARAQ
eukprot:1712917-Alexandrium_andersonii.AAC.1